MPHCPSKRLTVSAESPTPPTHFRHPRHWPTWLGLGLLWALAQLPLPLAQQLGRGLGRLFYLLGGRRRFIADYNLQRAFPELDPSARHALLKQHFGAAGMGIMEAAMSWWAPQARLDALAQIEGIEHLHAALAGGKGVILLSAHFTSLEIGGRLLAAHLPLHVVYRPHENPLFEQVMGANRARRYGKAIARGDMRSMIKSLKAGHPVWYATDQNYGHKNSVFAPFFGVQCATNTSTSRIAKISGAPVVPFFTTRLAQGRGFLLHFDAPLADFPSDQVRTDATRLNTLIEDHVRRFPEQYLWIHRRFKDHPDGGPDRYSRHAQRRD